MTRAEYEIGDLVIVLCDDEHYKDVWEHRGKVGVVIKKEAFGSDRHGHYFIYTVSIGEVNEVFERGDLMLVNPRVTEDLTVL